MNFYMNEIDAIIGLHEMGYTNDFKLSGNNLIWIQGKLSIPAGDFSIMESHRFCNYTKKGRDLVLLGVFAIDHNVKGILIKHSSKYTRSESPIIVRKLYEMFINQRHSWKNNSNSINFT